MKDASEADIKSKIEAATPPLVLAFRSTEEHALLSTLLDRFMIADRDGSGALDREELTSAIYHVYRAGKKSKKATVVQQEVDGAMHDFDKDGSGTLEFGEYVAMVCRGQGFPIAASEGTKEKVIALGLALEATMAATEGTPQARRKKWQVQHDAASEVAVLTELFCHADTSGDGALDLEELTEVMASYYKNARVSRSKEKIRDEMERALEKYDVDRSGTIELAEFLQLIQDLPSNNPDVTALVAEAGTKLRKDIEQTRQAAVLIQAGVRGRLVRAIRMDAEAATFRLFQGEVC